MRSTLALAALAGLPLLGACAGSSSSGPAQPAGTPPGTAAPTTTGSPAAAGANWVKVVDNAWLPLTPGSRWVYRGAEGGHATRDVMQVDRRTKLIAGVHATVVHDDLFTASGRPVERTDDWYAQDGAGNVWYMGEDTAELTRSGAVRSRGGSWQAGRGGASAGIIMYAHPKVGTSYAQEVLPGKAEDHARVLSLAASVRVPAAHSTAALLTREWSPLEAHVVEHKYYVRGVGDVRDLVVKGPTEYSRLVSYRPGT